MRTIAPYTRARRGPLGSQVCRNCRSAGSQRLLDGTTVHWCLQRERSLGQAPQLRPACADFLRAA